MLKNSEHRLLKKNYSLKIFNKLKMKKLFNFLLYKNNRIVFIKKILLTNKLRFLVPGLKNTCSITGKYKTVFNGLKVSRHVYKNFGDTSFLPNFTKMSWKCLKT